MNTPELLPLPRWMETYRIPGDDFHTDPDQYLSERMQSYALANLAALQAENERLLAEVAEWKRVAAAQAELHVESEDRAERLAEALEEIRSRSTMNLAMRSDTFELTAWLGDIYQIADAALCQEDRND